VSDNPDWVDQAPPADQDPPADQAPEQEAQPDPTPQEPAPQEPAAEPPAVEDQQGEQSGQTVIPADLPVSQIQEASAPPPEPEFPSHLRFENGESALIETWTKSWVRWFAQFGHSAD
jgi:hypothetical protein